MRRAKLEQWQRVARVCRLMLLYIMVVLGWLSECVVPGLEEWAIILVLCRLVEIGE